MLSLSIFSKVALRENSDFDLNEPTNEAETVPVLRVASTSKVKLPETSDGVKEVVNLAVDNYKMHQSAMCDKVSEMVPHR